MLKPFYFLLIIFFIAPSKLSKVMILFLFCISAFLSISTAFLTNSITCFLSNLSSLYKFSYIHLIKLLEYFDEFILLQNKI